MNLMKWIFLAGLFLPGLTTLNNLCLADDSEIPVVLEIEEISLSPYQGPAQQQRELKLNLELKPGFKAYVDKFSLAILEPYPTVQNPLSISPTHEFFDKFSKTKKLGIKEKATLSTLVEIQKPVPVGTQKLFIELSFQACSESVCYFPQTLKKEVVFEVLESPSPNAQVPTNLLEENFSTAQKKGIPYLLFFVFLAGVLTSLTPCLLPMLPLTIAVIGRGHGHDAKLKKFMNALIYILGIATTYSLLGVVAASSGALFGNLLSNTWVQMGFGGAFVFMGLAQFGLFEFQTPLWLQNRFHTLGNNAGGIYVSGLISGFIASPCVGPVLVGILTFIAQTQDRLLGFGLMFAYALGLGQLLLILGVSSSLLYRFPRAPWIMKTSKTILGVALIASGLFYLSLVWPDKIGLQTAPPMDSQTEKTPSLPWQPLSEESLQAAQKTGKPILIDFFADWCLACHELEEKAFRHPMVKEELQEFILLRFDATNDSPALNAYKKKYDLVGLPTIIFYDGQGHWRKDLTLNEFESPESFEKRLKKALAKP